jgi:hypothetical protein
MQADGAHAQFAFVEQLHLIGADVLLSELGRRPMEVPGEIFHYLQVGYCGSLREITTLEFFQHHCSEMGYRDLLVTQRLRRFARTPQPTHTRSVRRAGGFVQTAKWRSERFDRVRNWQTRHFPTDRGQREFHGISANRAEKTERLS